VSELLSWLSRSEQTVANMPLVDSTTDMATIVEEVRVLKVIHILFLSHSRIAVFSAACFVID
jgi:hypothetical protein